MPYLLISIYIYDLAEFLGEVNEQPTRFCYADDIVILIDKSFKMKNMLRKSAVFT